MRKDVNELRRVVHATLAREARAAAVSPDDFQEVFLTGATGFVGRFFLRELLRQNERLIVHCLVRAESAEHGFARLREALEQKVTQRLEEATGKLVKRADEEAARFVRVLEEQRRRITSTRSRTDENLDQLLLDLGEVKAERRQLESNRKYWEQRLRTIDQDLAEEPDRIRRTLELRTHRVEPAGAIYLWPQEATH